MAHYYDYDPSLSKEEFPVDFSIGGKSFSLSSSAGVFSSSRLDTGSEILARTMIDHDAIKGDVLDLGCGIGVLGVICHVFGAKSVRGIDVNEQACALAKKNYEKYGLPGDILHQDHIDDSLYNTIVLNPPHPRGQKRDLFPV